MKNMAELQGGLKHILLFDKRFFFFTIVIYIANNEKDSTEKVLLFLKKIAIFVYHPSVMSPLDNSSDSSSKAGLRENEIIYGTSGNY